MAKENFSFWLLSPETARIRQDLQKEVEKTNKEVLSGNILPLAQLEREYSLLIGYRKGLLFLEELLDSYKDEEEIENLSDLDN